MDIWLLRHAAAEDEARSGRDADRALTAEGLARAEAVARGLSRLRPSIARVVSSPYLRARQTAGAAARALGLAEIAESRALEPDAEPEEILNELAETGGDALLVGHQPQLGALLGRLIGGDVEIPLSKAAWRKSR
ncbi:MAG TPA: histidine phosphatase family protein [Thermoanaerobaculia bacterium]|nr:histidine phosphatase family protein [Thermoanaerobaculia bacterium]